LEDALEIATEGSQSEFHVSSFPRQFGDYELIEEIARGGMGIVYKARQKSLDRFVAVKMLLAGSFASDELIRRFKSEGIAAGRLQHPNIVAIHEVGVHDDRHFLVMDFVDGASLATLVGDQPLTAERAATYLKAIAEAIHAAHERDVLHRDLKPSNVLIDGADQPRVTDFGLARHLDGESSLTISGQMLGTPSYMPPEQAAALRDQISPRSDVYGLGAILYHALTGRPPFHGATIGETVNQVLNKEPMSPRRLNPKLPVDLEYYLLEMLGEGTGTALRNGARSCRGNWTFSARGSNRGPPTAPIRAGFSLVPPQSCSDKLNRGGGRGGHRRHGGVAASEGLETKRQGDSLCVRRLSGRTGPDRN
jgi:serine/threonine protein kinase